MNPLKLLEPDERERYDYLQEVFEEEIEQTHLAFHLSSNLVYELLNLLAACKYLFDEFGFPESEDNGQQQGDSLDHSENLRPLRLPGVNPSDYPAQGIA